MDETRMAARLPHLDVEVTRRLSDDGDAETMTIKVVATPNFQAVAETLVPQMWMLPFLAANPVMAAWADIVDQAWQPWRALLPPTPAKD